MSESPETNPIPTTEPPPEPTFYIEPSTGLISIDWHGPRPDFVTMTGLALEESVAQHNEMLTTIMQATEALKVVTERAAKMETLLTIVRLGRRPSRADWDSVELPRLTKEVRMNLMSRKRPTSAHPSR